MASNELVERDGRISARDTGEREEIEAGLVLRSIGYKGVPVEGRALPDEAVPVPNEAGRVKEESEARRSRACTRSAGSSAVPRA